MPPTRRNATAVLTDYAIPSTVVREISDKKFGGSVGLLLRLSGHVGQDHVDVGVDGCFDV